MTDGVRVNHEKALRLLGLARRAGAVQFGAEACEKTGRQGKAHLLLLAKDAGQSTKSRFDRLSKETGVELVMLGEAYELASAIGRKKVVIVAVTVKDFADGIKNAVMSQSS